MSENAVQWNHLEWKEAFRQEGADYHQLRVQVWLNTLEVVRTGKYLTEQGEEITLALKPTDFAYPSEHYYRAFLPFQSHRSQNPPEITVSPRDCLEIAHEWVSQGIETTVLNMANRRVPGGGVQGGAGAQEEYLFRCSDYYRFLFPFSNFASEYGLREQSGGYPMDRNFGGFYSKGVTIFRGTEAEGYPLRRPWQVNMIAVAGMNRPKTVRTEKGERIVDSLASGVKNKIRTIFRIAMDHRQRNLVLGALGCGAFKNPPRHVAELFRDILSEEEFIGRFDRICFAVKTDHNSHGGRNYSAFYSVLNGLKPVCQRGPTILMKGKMKDVYAPYTVYSNGVVEIDGYGDALAFNLRDFMRTDRDDAVFHAKVTGRFHTLASRAFFDWFSLKSVQLPRSIRVIEFNAFSDCDNLEELTMPGDIERFDPEMFAEYYQPIPERVIFYDDCGLNPELVEFFRAHGSKMYYRGRYL